MEQKGLGQPFLQRKFDDLKRFVADGKGEAQIGLVRNGVLPQRQTFPTDNERAVRL